MYLNSQLQYSQLNKKIQNNQYSLKSNNQKSLKIKKCEQNVVIKQNNFDFEKQKLFISNQKQWLANLKSNQAYLAMNYNANTNLNEKTDIKSAQINKNEFDVQHLTKTVKNTPFSTKYNTQSVKKNNNQEVIYSQNKKKQEILIYTPQQIQQSKYKIQQNDFQKQIKQSKVLLSVQEIREIENRNCNEKNIHKITSSTSRKKLRSESSKDSKGSVKIQVKNGIGSANTERYNKYLQNQMININIDLRRDIQNSYMNNSNKTNEKLNQNLNQGGYDSKISRKTQRASDLKIKRFSLSNKIQNFEPTVLKQNPKVNYMKYASGVRTTRQNYECYKNQVNHLNTPITHREERRNQQIEISNKNRRNQQIEISNKNHSRSKSNLSKYTQLKEYGGQDQQILNEQRRYKVQETENEKGKKIQMSRLKSEKSGLNREKIENKIQESRSKAGEGAWSKQENEECFIACKNDNEIQNEKQTDNKILQLRHSQKKYSQLGYGFQNQKQLQLGYSHKIQNKLESQQITETQKHLGNEQIRKSFQTKSHNLQVVKTQQKQPLKTVKQQKKIHTLCYSNKLNQERFYQIIPNKSYTNKKERHSENLNVNSNLYQVKSATQRLFQNSYSNQRFSQNLYENIYPPNIRFSQKLCENQNDLFKINKNTQFIEQKNYGFVQAGLYSRLNQKIQNSNEKSNSFLNHLGKLNSNSNLFSQQTKNKNIQFFSNKNLNMNLKNDIANQNVDMKYVDEQVNKNSTHKFLRNDLTKINEEKVKKRPIRLTLQKKY